MNESDYRSKQSIRNKVWCFMEENNISEFPRPSFYRIPNFKGADEACEKVVNLEEFQKAITVKVCPDSPQKHLRFLILQKNKTLLMSKPGLKDSMFYKVVPPCNVTDDVLHLCSSLKGAKQYGVEMPNNEVKVDLIVIGHRIGKGKGYADLGYSIMSSLNAITPLTPLVTVVHDCQVFETLPKEIFEPHDVPVDIIVTPTRIINCKPILPKPNSIVWPLISKEKINLLPSLKKLKLINTKLKKKI